MTPDIFSWNPHGHIDPDTLAAPTPSPATHWPLGLDPEEFTPAQRETIEDWYIRNLQNQLTAFYRLLRATAPGTQLTPTTVGINAAIIARLLKLTPDLAETPWGEMAAELHCRPHRFFQQKQAVIEQLHHVNKQLPRKYKN